MPTAAEFQALHDELRQLGAVFVQAANWWAREAADNEAAAMAAAAIERSQRAG